MKITAAVSLARQLMDDHGLTDWSLRWDSAKTRLGYCNFSRRSLSFSRVLVANATDDVVRNTILHEIAHALVGPRHGHDAVWVAKAREIGCTGTRCFDWKDVVAPPHKWEATCGGCGKVFRKHRLVRPMAKRWCRKCGRVKGDLIFRERARAAA